MQSAEGLTARLEICVARMGGKRALATASGVSEAQLYRYITDGSAVPAERLLALAHAAKVDAGWLLTGEGPMEAAAKGDGRPLFRPELLTEVTQMFEELLVEYEKTFTPRQRARAITLMYEALRHEEVLTGQTVMPSKFDILKIVSFLSELRTEEELDLLLAGLNLLEYGPKPRNLGGHLQLLISYCNLIARGYRAYYSSYAGQVYFERMGQQLGANGIKYLDERVTQACTLTGRKELDWLDLGCGNGRHLAHLHRNYANVRVKGLEPSGLGMELCHALMRSERLPVGTVTMGDMRELPYASGSFDVVFSRLVLHALPYLPGTGVGMEVAFEEIARVLRPGGVAMLTLLHGKGQSYLLPRQRVDEDDVAALAAGCGLKVTGSRRVEGTSKINTCEVKMGQPLVDATLLEVVLQK